MRRPTIEIAVSPQALKMLQRLARSGLYGRSVAGVAREFLYAGLREHLVENVRRSNASR